jgi:hypothetical protein
LGRKTLPSGWRCGPLALGAAAHRRGRGLRRPAPATRGQGSTGATSSREASVRDATRFMLQLRREPDGSAATRRPTDSRTARAAMRAAAQPAYFFHAVRMRGLVGMRGSSWMIEFAGQQVDSRAGRHGAP